MKSKMMKLNVSKKLLGVFAFVLCISTVSAQSPDKRSWKQRLDKPKKEQVMCSTTLLLQEIGLKQKGDALLCATSNQALTLEEVTSRFSNRTSTLIFASGNDRCLEVKKEQLSYVRRLNAIVRNMTSPTADITAGNMLAATAANEQLRIIDAWCANRQDAEVESKLHYQLLQRVATIF